MDKVDELVHKIIRGDLRMTRDERQTYANHSKEIEERLEDVRQLIEDE